VATGSEANWNSEGRRSRSPVRRGPLRQPDFNSVGLTWIRPKSSTGLYRNGFTNVYRGNQILLSPDFGGPPGNFNLMTNPWILETIGDANTPIPVSTATLYEVIGASVSGIVNASGLLKVTIGSGVCEPNLA